MPNPVVLFNASNIPLAVAINAGPQLPLSATGGIYDWAPFPQSAPPFPGLSRGYPEPNTIGFDLPNGLVAYIAGSPKPSPPFQFTIPAGTQFNAIQIYLFYASPTQCHWIALLDGKLFSELTSNFQP